MLKPCIGINFFLRTQRRSRGQRLPTDLRLKCAHGLRRRLAAADKRDALDNPGLPS